MYKYIILFFISYLTLNVNTYASDDESRDSASSYSKQTYISMDAGSLTYTPLPPLENWDYSPKRNEWTTHLSGVGTIKIWQSSYVNECRFYLGNPNIGYTATTLQDAHTSITAFLKERSPKGK